MLARREADDRQPRFPVAERRHRRVPPVGMLGAAFLAEGDQPRAQRAVARRLGLGHRRQIGGGGEPIAPDLGERQCQAQRTSTPSRSAPTGRHGRHGRPAGRGRGRDRAARRGFRPVRCLADHAQRRASAAPGRDFANAVALVESDARAARRCSPRSRRIERDFGRRPGRRWGPRVLDLDIVAVERRHVRLAPPDHPAPAARRAAASCLSRSPRSRPAGGSIGRADRAPSRRTALPAARPRRLTAPRAVGP